MVEHGLATQLQCRLCSLNNYLMLKKYSPKVDIINRLFYLPILKTQPCHFGQTFIYIYWLRQIFIYFKSQSNTGDSGKRFRTPQLARDHSFRFTERVVACISVTKLFKKYGLFFATIFLECKSEKFFCGTRLTSVSEFTSIFSKGRDKRVFFLANCRIR